MRLRVESLLVWALAGMAFVGGSALTSTAEAQVDVRIKLPVRARLDLTDRRTLLPTPFIVISQEGEGRIEGTDIDVQREFERYLQKILRRDTDLKVLESGPIDYPTYDLDMLARDEDFWRFIGERAQADLILVGSLDFDSVACAGRIWLASGEGPKLSAADGVRVLVLEDIHDPLWRDPTARVRRRSQPSMPRRWVRLWLSAPWRRG